MNVSSDWNSIRARLAGTLSKEDEHILDLLVAGESTPAIARELRQHRSMIWRKVQKLRARAAQ
jgi:biotin operon repressor